MSVRHSITFLCLITALVLHSQSLHPRYITSLPAEVVESSGIEISSVGEIWTHNDSGDLPRIFKVDTMGNLLRTIHLKGIQAVDFEDITTDENGNFYIGDFGNNLNLRQDLVIYKIPDPSIIAGDSVVPLAIRFRYPDQSLFPPSFNDWNFDCEALFHAGDSLYLFSKNRGTSSYSRMYRLPDKEGTYVAQLVDSFDTKKWITSADISPSGKAMILLSYDRMWLFTGFTGNQFLKGKAREILIDSTQKEGVVFINDSAIYLTDELFMGLGGNLYSLGLESYINGIDELILPGRKIILGPNPSTGTIMIWIPLRTALSATLRITSANGQVLLHENHWLHAGDNEIHLDLTGLQPGLHLLNISHGEDPFYSRKILLKTR